MQKKYNVYPNLGYWFLLIIPLLFGGFYTSYFSTLFQPKPTIIHIHFILMALWIMMVITQPFLIKFKKLYLHRLVGKCSYVLVPLLLLSTIFIIRYSFYAGIDRVMTGSATSTTPVSYAEAAKISATEGAIGTVYFLWLTIFYALAIINRRPSPVHARYMLAAALTVLGPTVDRIFFIVFHMETFPLGIPIYAGAFSLEVSILGLLLWKDYQHKKPTRTLWTAILIYLAGQTLFFTLKDTASWQQFFILLMKSAP
ncbi:hypothetical protein [Flavihumibacter fluvii]|uniref:hypothetical protein n=1 Tax=Flavihumibacter fluvii TaxID=2838157 RepID=UPI001BDE5B5F|nr:hypothetical protein [Flavihumibacter fluvii]ULQ52978.1 hypothetical protein KJS93_01440 [Flavihumibacter fluvii]